MFKRDLARNRSELNSLIAEVNWKIDLLRGKARRVLFHVFSLIA